MKSQLKPSRLRRPRRLRGFTLIELMIVVGIVAILASIAYPSYRDSVLKGRRAEARAALADLLQQQERYLTQRNTYLVITDATAGPAPFKTYSGDGPTNPKYQLRAEQCTDAGGTVLAVNECIQVTAVPALADPQVATLKANSIGDKTCTGTSADANGHSKLCWP
jgi:type IV pilus assembly protein PilE